MGSEQNDLSLLSDPVAQELLTSTNMAHLAYVWSDGTPRVVPMWFHWNGSEIVFGSPPAAPKVHASLQGARVAVEIDSTEWPYKVLQIRGTASVETVQGVSPEYTMAAKRYFGEEQGLAWSQNVGRMSPTMVRIKVKPDWVNILDFEKRLPSGIVKAMAAMGSSTE